MTAVNNFVSELVRAANEVEKLTSSERQRLLERAVITIKDMRETIEVPSAQDDADRIVGLQVLVAARGVRATESAEVRDALLTAAGMIRDLHLVLRAGTEIEIGDGGRNGGTDRW
jgi:hypothetical protein